MSEPLISVVVPVYNVKSYLTECIESIFNQTYRNLEIIIVDDGSKDGSGELCDELARRDSRSVVIHKANGGLSDARNAGVARAGGSYVAFVDSDDYVSPVFVEALYRGVFETGCRMCAVPFGHVFSDGEPAGLIQSLDDRRLGAVGVQTELQAQRSLLYQAFDTGAPWRLYERDILGDTPFPEGLYYEDLASVYRFVRRAGSVATLATNELYAYRARSTSIIRKTYTPLKMRSVVTVTRALHADICAWYPELGAAVASRCFSANRMVFAQIPPAERADREAVWGELTRYRGEVLRDGDARRRERLAAAIACMGMGAFSAFCAACRKVGLLR